MKHEIHLMHAIIRLFLVLSQLLMLCGCFSGAVQPTVNDHYLRTPYPLLNNLVLTKRVVLEQGSKKVESFGSYKYVDVTATSNFGNEDETANVDCVVSGLSDILKNLTIITPTEFWERIGEDQNTVNLTALFDGRYSHAINNLDLDYIVVAYHQLIDVSSFLLELVAEGGYGGEDRETAATVTIDMKKRYVIDAIEVDARHHEAVFHFIYVLPLIVNRHPKEEPCQIVGKHAGEAINRSLSTNKVPSIAVVVAQTNPYLSLPHATPESAGLGYSVHYGSNAEWRLKKQIGAYCPNADLGHKEAQKRIGDLYYLGLFGLEKDLVRAYVWYILAANAGDNGAAKQVDLLKNELSTQQINEAQILLEEWGPGQCERDLMGAISEERE